jgi:hypothetical protein
LTAGRGPDTLVRSPPLLVTAVLPPAVFAWADGLRRAHYPPERNRLAAHVTLLHALPPSAEEEVRRLLSSEAGRMVPPEAEIVGVMDLGGGTAFSIRSRDLEALHADLAHRLSGVIQQRDNRPLRLHITVQNKVPRAEAQELQNALAAAAHPGPFRFAGLLLSHWRDEAWQPAQTYRFRGRLGS